MYRTINKYCLPMLADCTPYIESDFDLCVREFCAQKQGLLAPPPPPPSPPKQPPTNDLINQQQQPATNKLLAPFPNFEAPTKQTTDTTEKNHNATIHSESVQMSAESINKIKSSPVQQQQPPQQKQTPQHHYGNLNNIPQSCKVIVTGDVAVGKTSLINRFGYDVYSSHYKTTIGVDFDVQKFQILGMPYVLQVRHHDFTTIIYSSELSPSTCSNTHRSLSFSLISLLSRVIRSGTRLVWNASNVSLPPITEAAKWLS